jgi:hypothetical protein
MRNSSGALCNALIKYSKSRISSIFEEYSPCYEM